MPNRAALTGKTIWLTRPAGQGEELCARLEALGAQVHMLPLLVIKPLEPSLAERQKLIDLDRYDLVFFVSTNAAVRGLELIRHWWPQYPAGIVNCAVGPGTAAVLESHGLSVIYPRERMSSEALLALPPLQCIEGKKALIVRGAGGREIIADGLHARGAAVDYVELYERASPAYSAEHIDALLRSAAPDAIVISSAEALDNLKTLFALVPGWKQLPLVVSSLRLAEHAKAAGFQSISVIEGATDTAIIAGLLSLSG